MPLISISVSVCFWLVMQSLFCTFFQMNVDPSNYFWISHHSFRLHWQVVLPVVHVQSHECYVHDVVLHKLVLTLAVVDYKFFSYKETMLKCWEEEKVCKSPIHCHVFREKNIPPCRVCLEFECENNLFLTG